MVIRAEFVNLLEPELRRAMGNYWGPLEYRKWYDHWDMTLAERAAAKLMGCQLVYYDFSMEAWRCACGAVRRQEEMPEALGWREFHACPSDR